MVIEKKTFRGVIIDPTTRTVDVVEVPRVGTLEAIKMHVKADGLDSFCIADHETSFDYGWVDDVGLSSGRQIDAFLLPIRKDPIAGRCLFVGVDKKTRDTCDAKFPLDVLRREITWLGAIKPEVTWDEIDKTSHAIVTYERVKQKTQSQ